jgi:CO/xanthine dehydrogenase FAD-binding subunit
MRDNLLFIGALATHSDLIRSPPPVPVVNLTLAAAAREVGGVQIQNRGTLMATSPTPTAADSQPVLAAADAVVAPQRGAGCRSPRSTRIPPVVDVRRADCGFEIPEINGEQ